MNFIAVNGVVFPSPERISIRYENVGSVDRAIDGTLVSDIAATKVHLTCNFSILEDRLLRTILGAASTILARVFYRNPINGSMVLLDMFVQINPGSTSFMKGSEIWWKDVECVFVEQ